MRLFHILAKDSSADQQRNFMRLLEVLSSVSDTHQTLCYPFRDVEAFLKKEKVSYSAQKFGGMFDLRTKQALHNILRTFNPHIVISHSGESASFTSTHIPTLPHIGIINGSDTDRYIASFCDHTVKVGEDMEDKDILKNTLSRFETVLKRHGEKT